MEREHRSILTLVTAEPFAAGASFRLDPGASHHVEVRRAKVGDPIRLLDGVGTVARGLIVGLKKGEVDVSLDAVENVPAPSSLEVIVPVADRERMLLAAEKCVELQVTAWRPAYFARSRSVGTRGEGEKFRQKVLARMQSALEQSGGGWLPVIQEEVDAVRALELALGLSRFLLHAGGTPLLSNQFDGRGTALAVGPEGGFERTELETAASLGWTTASLGSTTLRFETAIIAGAAVIRAAQLRPGRT